MGFASLVEEVSTPGGKLVRITGVKNPGRTVSVLVRGSNRLMLEEAERSFHDSLCVVRCIVKQRLVEMVMGRGHEEAERERIVMAAIPACQPPSKTHPCIS